MEATVYARDDATVLKVYRQPPALPNLHVLQQFYDLLDGEDVPFALPRIFAVEDHGDAIATVERRFTGVPMTERISASNAASFYERYLDAAFAVGRVRLRAPLGRLKLFDPGGISTSDDWHTFLRRFVDQAAARSAPFLRRDVGDWDGKRGALNARLAAPYDGPMALIHGDVFPGNILMDGDQITALLDFGIFTMWGDPLWDIATACAFFDMYGARSTRDDLLAWATQRLGAHVRPRFALYILLYSLVAADAYDPTCEDGHYRWCIANLNDDGWWN